MVVIPRAFALGGVAGPMVFGSIVIVCAELRPEYRHFSQLMSELGETGSRTELLMNYLGFLPSALLILLSSLVLLASFRATWLGAFGSLCVSLFAVGMLAAGLFPCDVSCTPDAPSQTQQLHFAAGMVADPAIALAPLLLAFRFRQLDRWRSMFSYSVATSVLSFSALIVTAWSLPDRSGSGLFQRLALGLPFLWLALVSWRLWASVEAGEAA
jgi:hypothetical protein